LDLKKKLSTWGIGLLGNFLIVKAIDYLAYPAAILYFGVVYGSLIMVIISIVLCLATFVFYDWAKKDWIGIETMKEMKETETKGRVSRIFQNLLKKGDLFALVVLSIKFDPFIATAYLRHGSNKFNGLSKRDWKIFIISTILSNGWWILIVWSGLSALEWLWKIFRS
jgi:hypothetical protein